MSFQVQVHNIIPCIMLPIQDTYVAAWNLVQPSGLQKSSETSETFWFPKSTD